MANNRLFLVDTATGHWILLAKGWGEWSLWNGNLERGELLARFLQDHDHGSAQAGTVPTGFVLMTERDELPACDDDPTMKPNRGWRPE